MSVLPVVYGDPPLPLIIDDGDDPVPALAEEGEACDCCDDTYNFCPCTCGEFVAQLDANEFDIAGFVDYTCPDICGGTPAIFWSILNGHYSVPTSTGVIDYGTLGNTADRGILYSQDPGTPGGGCNGNKTYLWRVEGSSVCIDGGLVWRFNFCFQSFRDSDGAFLGSSKLFSPLAFEIGVVWEEDCEGIGNGPSATGSFFGYTVPGGCSPSGTVATTITAQSVCPGCDCE